jgi:hypothetical protein
MVVELRPLRVDFYETGPDGTEMGELGAATSCAFPSNMARAPSTPTARR